MGKTRYTQNQDYFKLSGSSPGSDIAARARRAFGMERARERLDMFMRSGSRQAAHSPRHPAVTPAEVLPSHAEPEAPIPTTSVANEPGPALDVRVPPLRLLDIAWDVARWPLLLLGRGWNLVRRTWGDIVDKTEQRSGRYLGLG
ncbi:MAG TPA: hypothetical protein VH877_02575 [Polyangia bacterium]|nr:hypothetical protein [Polyangia bacterium]